MTTFGEVYNLHYSDGTVDEKVVVPGDLKQVGDTFELENGRWVVTDLWLPDPSAEHVFDIAVVSAGE